MRWLNVSRRARAAGSAAAVAGLLALLLPGCAGGGNLPAADRAFALSASALSGMDSYGINGEVSILDPNGVVADYSRYEGQVTGHGNLKLTWTGGQMIRTRSASGPPAFRPMQLVSAVRDGTAKVSYADSNGTAGGGKVNLKILLDPDTARKPFVDNLRAEMAKLKDNAASRNLPPSKRNEADRILDDANRELEAALSTLKVNTVILWNADRKTWFPSRMTEQSELSYTWKGKSFREKRMSATNFLQAGSSGTMIEQTTRSS